MPDDDIVAQELDRWKHAMVGMYHDFQSMGIASDSRDDLECRCNDYLASVGGGKVRTFTACYSDGFKDDVVVGYRILYVTGKTLVSSLVYGVMVTDKDYYLILDSIAESEARSYNVHDSNESAS